jgi:hypothetical protein
MTQFFPPVTITRPEMTKKDHPFSDTHFLHCIEQKEVFCVFCKCQYTHWSHSYEFYSNTSAAQHGKGDI